MENIEAVHELLYYALINIRQEAHERGDTVSFHLADLFHNAAVMMGKAAKGERTYDEVMAEIANRAKAKGCEKWVEDHLQQINAGDSRVVGELQVQNNVQVVDSR